MVVKFLVYLIFTIIGVLMVLGATKMHSDKEGHKPSVTRNELNSFEVSLILIGGLMASGSFVALLRLLGRL